MLKPITQKSFSEREEEITHYWKEQSIFEKSVENRPEDKRWNFLDGPPFVTGMPHYGSLLSSLPKDVFGRYWTMKGYRVRRVWGWDGHGLPIENKVENKLYVKRKKDIEEVVGVKTFIEECYNYVAQVSGEWEWYIDKIGRWVDFKNAYRTWDKDYMESVMWVFKQMYDRGHIYKGLRVSLYCPHCSTPISNFEIAMDSDNYKDISENADTYKYKLKNEDNTFILAWSTTPWNKLVTPSLAINPKLTYVKVKQGSEFYILAEATLKHLKKDEKYEEVEKFSGEKLVGREFEPHYDFYLSWDSVKNDLEEKKMFVIVGGDFVTADEGTGVVTLAAYGEEDLAIMQKENIPLVIHVDDEGIIDERVPSFGGMFYMDANALVNEDLASRGLLYSEEKYTHSVPHCWRCATRLFYNPQNAWYVAVGNLKPAMKKTNEEVNWIPKHFKNGRYLKSLESAPDWCISRSRYWGSPVPVWECECGQRVVPGSVKELEELSGQKVESLHKPDIDEVIIPCNKCGKDARRVSEVLDSWIEAGSASFAERHFPFSGAILQDFFPPDFIAEYTGQIRAWFYVLHVISTAIYDSVAFKNVLVEGVILGTDGRKMSKNYGNYPDPKMLLEKYGGDALRMYLLGSPVMNGEDIRISEIEYRDQLRGTLLILWNVYNFFVMYAISDNWQGVNPQFKSQNPLDKWIISKLNHLKLDVTTQLEQYNTVGAISSIKKFIDELSTWYIRRSRDRVGPTSEDVADRDAFYQTTHQVLTSISLLMAPITPFVTEEMYRNLTGNESVHLENWPVADDSQTNEELEKTMEGAIALSSVLNSFRKENTVKVKIPFKKLTYDGPMELPQEILEIVKLEGNVIEFVFENKGESYFVKGDVTSQNQDLEAGEARDIIRKIQQERKNLSTSISEYVNVTLPSWPESYQELIKKKALVQNLTKSDEFTVEKIT